MRETLNTVVLDELRSKIGGGQTAVEGVRFLIDRLQLKPDSQLIVIRYFRAAFGVDLKDAAKLGAWQFFTGGTWSDEFLNTELTAILLRCLKDKSYLSQNVLGNDLT